MKPSYEQLEEYCRHLEAERQHLKEAAHKLADRLRTAEEKLRTNSQNSAKPPSSDQKKNTPDRPKKSRPPREGCTRTDVSPDKIDRHEHCRCDHCPHCGSDSIFESARPVILQQVDLPETKSIVTQFERHRYQCNGCNRHLLAPLPSGVPNSAFSPRVMALAGMLTGVYHLSRDETRDLIKTLYNIDVSEGSQTNIEKRVCAALKPVDARIHRFVLGSAFCKHFDETSWRDGGKTHYVWVAATKQAVCYRIDRFRNKTAFLKLAVSLNEEAPVVTDRYAVYNGLTNPHQFCIPHLIRNIRKFSERGGEDGVFGQKIEKELQLVCHIHGQYRRGEMRKSVWSQQLRHCRNRIDNLLLDCICSASKKMGDLCQKIWLEDFENLWVFRHHPDAEPSNNLAERDLRRIVLWRKKSQGSRSDSGKTFVEIMTGVAGTLRRAGTRFMNFLVEALTNFYSSRDAPLIRPEYGF